MSGDAPSRKPVPVVLRDVQEDDLPILFRHQRDPEALRMAAFPSRDWDAFCTHWRVNVLGKAENRKQTIVVGNTVVGHVVSWLHQDQRLVGYWIDREFWGQGIATAALSAFLQQELTRPLRALVAVDNLGSIRVLEKCGFRRVGEPETGADRVTEHQFLLPA